MISIAFSLFLLMNPIGNIPFYVSFLRGIHPKRQARIICRELFISLLIIILFAFAGNALLQVLHIELPTVQISGGLILFILSLRMIFPPSEEDHEEDLSKKAKQEPLIVPLAIPLVAGPGVLAAVMIYANQTIHEWELVAAIFIAWFATFLILLLSSWFQKVLGWRGVIALERLMGLLLILIAIQMFLIGWRAFSAVPSLA